MIYQIRLSFLKIEVYRDGKLKYLIKSGYYFFVWKFKVYEEGRLILKATYCNNVFFKSLKITFQQLPEPIIAETIDGEFYVFNSDTTFSSIRYAKGNVRFDLGRNSKLAGQVIGPARTFMATEFLLTVNFKDDDPANLYSLLSFFISNPRIIM